MEGKPCMTLILILLFLLSVPCFSRVGLRVPKRDSEVYDIDYRGPETHSYRPPPNRSGRGNRNTNSHQKSAVPHHRSKIATRNGKKVHG